MTLTDLYAQTPVAKRPGIDVQGDHVTVHDGSLSTTYRIDDKGNLTLLGDNSALLTRIANLETNVKAVAAKVGILAKDIV